MSSSLKEIKWIGDWCPHEGQRGSVRAGLRVMEKRETQNQKLASWLPAIRCDVLKAIFLVTLNIGPCKSSEL